MSDDLQELHRLRERVRELEQRQVSELQLAPGGELASEVLRSLLQDAGVFLTLLNRQGEMVFISRTDEAHPLEQVRGKSLFDWTKREQHSAFREALDRVFAERCQVYVESESVQGGWYGNHLGPIVVNGQVLAVGNFSENVTQRREVEQKLRESEARWRSLAESVPDSVVLLDMQGRFISATPPVLKVASEQLASMSGTDFVIPEHRELVNSALESVRRTGEPVDIEVQEALNRRWYLSRIGPLWGDGVMIGTISVSRDISRRIEREQVLRESESRLQFLLNNMPAIAWTVDAALRCTSIAGAGLTPEAALGKDLSQFFGINPSDEPTAGLKRALAGESVTIEFQWSGRDYHALIEPLRDPDGKVTGASGVAVDITARSTVERQVRNDRDDLERRVTERTEQLKAANRSLLKERRVLQRLLDLHDRDRQLVAYEIHDGLVQDMAGAAMFFESSSDAVRQQGGVAAEHYGQALHLLRTSIQEARRLIDGLRPPVLEEYGLIDAIGNHVEELRARYGIDVEFEHDVKFVRLSPVVERAMYRIVQESLNNLALHSGTSRAFVSLHQFDEYVKIVVRDWGLGFDIETTKPKRFGLLSIRDRARLLGGQALITSAPGEGTTIKVSLPVADVLLPSAARRVEDPESSSA